MASAVRDGAGTAPGGLTVERLRELLDYDADLGRFRSRVYRCGRATAGSIAGSAKGRGYRHLNVDGRLYIEHRLVWFYVHGVWPEGEIDHINGVRDDNRIANLRVVPRTAENRQNTRKVRSDSRVGIQGVKRSGTRWKAVITVRGKVHNIGSFVTPEEAGAAYLAAKAELHPYWAKDVA
jgi:hypothetical protein